MCFQLTPEYLLDILKNTIKRQQTFVVYEFLCYLQVNLQKGNGVLGVNILKYLYIVIRPISNEYKCQIIIIRKITFVFILLLFKCSEENNIKCVPIYHYTLLPILISSMQFNDGALVFGRMCTLQCEQQQQQYSCNYTMLV